LNLKRTDIDPSVPYTIEPGTTLISKRRRGEVRVTCVNRRTTGEELMGEGRAAVALQRTEERIGIDLVARTSEEPAAVIATEIVAVRCDGAAVVSDIGA
jgi:hypothetical protein